MRRTRWWLAALVAVVLTGCGDGDEDEGASADGDDSPPAAASPSASPSGGGAGGTTLTAAVGDGADPDAFVITLKDASGADVETLPAGEYQIQVSDPSTIHNVHLTGGGVDETTSVPETGDVTWTVTLEAGTYQVVCDPHPPMRIEITVT